MPEIMRAPIEREKLDGLDNGPFIIFDDDHSHGDVLRYVVADVGKEHALAILNSMGTES